MVLGTVYGSLPLDVDGAPPRTSFAADDGNGALVRIYTPTSAREQEVESCLRSDRGSDQGETERHWRRRRTIALALVGVTCGVVGIAGLAASRHGLVRHRMSQPSTVFDAEHSASSPVDADPTALVLQRPELKQPEIRQSTGGLLETTFRIAPALVDVGPLSFFTRAYEGTVPGPVIMVNPGDVVRINQVNKLGPEHSLKFVEHTFHLPNTTTIHTHGLHVSPSGIEDNVFRVLYSGQEAVSEYHIRDDHQPGTFYYHPHYHGSSTIQQAGGMSGAIIVKDDPATLPEELRGIRDLVLMLQHINMQKGTFSNYVYASHALRSGLDPSVHYKSEEVKQGNFYIVNGQHQPRLTVAPGELVRLRLINAGVGDELLLHIPGCEVYGMAADGVTYPAPRMFPHGLLMAVGSRKDILLRCPKEGVYTAQSGKTFESDAKLLKDYLGWRTSVYTGVLFYVHATGEPESSRVPLSLPAPTFPTHPQFEDLRPLATTDVNHFDFQFLVGPSVPRAGFMYGWYGVNGHLVSIYQAQRLVRLGDVEQWRVSIRRSDGQHEPQQHPFHIHINHFQILNASHGLGYDYEIGDWRDTITYPAANPPEFTEAWVDIRWRANDFTGKAPAHCHIFPHADTGMTLTFEVVDKDVQIQQPSVTSSDLIAEGPIADQHMADGHMAMPTEDASMGHGPHM